MAQDDKTQEADERGRSHPDGASQEIANHVNDVERLRAVAYLDLWERQIALTAAGCRFSQLRGQRSDRGSR